MKCQGEGKIDERVTSGKAAHGVPTFNRMMRRFLIWLLVKLYGMPGFRTADFGDIVFSAMWAKRELVQGLVLFYWTEDKPITGRDVETRGFCLRHCGVANCNCLREHVRKFHDRSARANGFLVDTDGAATKEGTL